MRRREGSLRSGVVLGGKPEESATPGRGWREGRGARGARRAWELLGRKHAHEGN